MGQNTSRLGLYLPGGGSTGLITPDEPADIDKINDNMTKLDADAGAYVCTSSTRPATPYNGKIIFETDTRKTMVYKSATTSWEPVDSQGKIVANAAARDALFASPVQGTKVFRTDTGVTETYYAAWNASTNPGGRTPAGWYIAERSTGLVALVPPTIRVSGGSATANTLGKVTFTTANSIALDGIFSSAYSNYKIFLNISAISANADIYFRYTQNGTPTSGSHFYGGGVYGGGNGANGNYNPNFGAANIVLATLLTTGYNYMGSSSDITITKNGNGYRMTQLSTTANTPPMGIMGGHLWNDDTVAFDGFRINNSATANMTGTLIAYGWNE